MLYNYRIIPYFQQLKENLKKKAKKKKLKNDNAVLGKKYEQINTNNF